MSAIWHRVKNRKNSDRDSLIKEMRASSPPPSREMRASGTAQRLKDHLDKCHESDDLLREKRNLLGRAPRLTNPEQLTRVTKWLRAPVETRSPRNQPVVEALMTASQVHALAVPMLCITMADTGLVTLQHRERAEPMQAAPRKLHDTTVWCEKLTHQQALDMCAYFRSPEGKRWTRAVRAALDEACNVNVGAPPVRRRLSQSALERMLAAFVTAQRITPAVVEAATKHLRPYDAELAEEFFWNDADHEGHHWLLLLSNTLRDMRETVGGGGRRSRGSSLSNGS